MKPFPFLFVACALAIPALAQDATTNALTEANVQSPGQTLLASAAEVTAPLVLTNDYIYLTGDQVEVAEGGKAVFNFTVTNAGDYEMEAMVSAPDEGANSFYLNMDAQPVDPDMIWDIDVTSGFEKRLVSWRGNGDPDYDQFSPKRFKLEPGAHTLIIVGREPEVQLKSLRIFPAPAAKPAAQ